MSDIETMAQSEAWRKRSKHTRFYRLRRDLYPYLHPIRWRRIKAEVAKWRKVGI